MYFSFVRGVVKSPTVLDESSIFLAGSGFLNSLRGSKVSLNWNFSGGRTILPTFVNVSVLWKYESY